MPALVIAVAWCAVIRILWTDWIIDPQYSYGILVPLLVIGLLLKRWENRPEPSRLSRLAELGIMIPLFGAILLIMIVIPMAQANPDWRPLGGSAVLAVVVLSLCFVTLMGGKSWLRHFAFPICFFLIAAPWPRNFEQGVMSPLMALNTFATLEILHWAGFEAVSRGNLIALPAGILGIEEACSGIRSLQSGLMVSLFFGEIFRLCLVRRLTLLVVALLAALVGNICRNTLLALIGSSQGLEAVAAWHDRAGLLVFFITFGTILGCAWLWKDHLPSLSFKLDSSRLALAATPPWISSAVALVLLMSSLVLTELWFGTHEYGGVTPWSWNLHSRQGSKGVFTVPIASSTLRMLFYPDGFSEKWIESRKAQGQVFYFQWPAGRVAAQAVTMHNPEVCLSSVGIVMNASLQPLVFKMGKEELTFKAWLFSDNGNPVYVFHTLVEQGARSGVSEMLSDSPIGRLRAVLTGHRNHGQRVVEVAFWNLSNESEARQALVRYLQKSIAPAATHSVPNSVKP